MRGPTPGTIESRNSASRSASDTSEPMSSAPVSRGDSSVLFFQRPLKEPVVGVCTFVHSERRLPKAHPLFQERRLYEEVNQLEITAPSPTVAAEASATATASSLTTAGPQIQTSVGDETLVDEGILPLAAPQATSCSALARRPCRGAQTAASVAGEREMDERNGEREEWWWVAGCRDENGSDRSR